MKASHFSFALQAAQQDAVVAFGIGGTMMPLLIASWFAVTAHWSPAPGALLVHCWPMYCGLGQYCAQSVLVEHPRVFQVQPTSVWVSQSPSAVSLAHKEAFLGSVEVQTPGVSKHALPGHSRMHSH